MAAGYLMGWEWPLSPRAILRPSLPWPSASAPGQATGPASWGGMEASCQGQLSVVQPGWQGQGGNTEALGLSALCYPPPSQVYLIINPHDLRERMKNKVCSLLGAVPLPTSPDVGTKGLELSMGQWPQNKAKNEQ